MMRMTSAMAVRREISMKHRLRTWQNRSAIASKSWRRFGSRKAGEPFAAGAKAISLLLADDTGRGGDPPTFVQRHYRAWPGLAQAIPLPPYPPWLAGGG